MNAKMEVFLFSIFCAILQGSHQNPTSHWTLLPHTLVVEVDGTVGQHPLSCLEPEELTRRENMNKDIFWRKNGIEKEQRGNTYLLQLEESLGGGNYTCHGKDGLLLNHTAVLIQEDKTNRRKILVKTDQEDYLKCSAQNYNGGFHCSWTWHRSRFGKVAFIKARRVSDNDDDQSKFSCSVDDSGNRILCLDKQHCPYAEESRQILITVYVRTEHFLVESYSKHFYLSEIVKPDKVTICKLNTTATAATIEWRYPSSWSCPYSYFPLTFQIAQLKGGCKRCDNPCTHSRATKTLEVNCTDVCRFEVQRSAKAVCVRAKDPLSNSQWSKWSHIRLRGFKKNKCLQRKNCA